MVHASALLVGATAVLVRGPSGSGKSSLVLDLIATLAAEGRFAMLIGDDYVSVEALNGRLIARAAPTVTGLIERRGYGVVGHDFEPAGIVGLVVDLVADQPDRLPESIDQRTELCGLTVKRIAISCADGRQSRSVLAAIDEEIAMPDAQFRVAS